MSEQNDDKVEEIFETNPDKDESGEPNSLPLRIPYWRSPNRQRSTL